jgi:hypothetical protein
MNTAWKCRLDSSSSERGLVTGSYERCNELQVLKGRYISWLTNEDYVLKDFPPRS